MKKGATPYRLLVVPRSVHLAPRVSRGNFFSCRCFFRLSLDGLSERGTTRSLDFVKSADVSYETFLRYQNDIEDLLPEKEGCGKDSDIDSDDENPADLVLGGMPLRMTLGRTVICPKHLDL